MIITKDTKPERQFYYLGGLLLDALRQAPGDTVELYGVYEKMNLQRTVSVSAFLLTLDWLFLLGIITNDQGRIRKCF